MLLFWDSLYSMAWEALRMKFDAKLDLESIKNFFKESATCGVLLVIDSDFNYTMRNIFYYDH